MSNETPVLVDDRLQLSFAAVIQRPRNNSLYVFDNMATMLKDEEITVEMDGYNKQTLRLAVGETKTIELIESDYCDLLCFISNGYVAVQLLDKTSFGFGEGSFGSGGFGGDSLGQTTQGINGLFVAQGKFTDMSLSNLADTQVIVEIFAVKFKV